MKNNKKNKKEEKEDKFGEGLAVVVRHLTNSADHRLEPERGEGMRVRRPEQVDCGADELIDE